MLSAVLGAAVLASTPASAPDTMVNPPVWLRMPGPEDMNRAVPSRARIKGVDGKVVLSCLYDPRGRLRDCAVAEESPGGFGFGMAALSLTGEFILKPSNAAAPGSRIRVPFRFFAPQAGARLTDTHDVTLMNTPIWLAAPTFAQVASAYPPAGKSDGYVTLRCVIGGEGSLETCAVTREYPLRQGFGRAAIGLSKAFKVKLNRFRSREEPDLNVDIPFHFIPPSREAMTARRLADPVWITAPDPNSRAMGFPPEALAKGVTTGRGVAECSVAADGTLKDCHPAAGQDDADGFSKSTVALASQMRMSRWTGDGGPVDGATIRLPIRFGLGEPTPAR